MTQGPYRDASIGGPGELTHCLFCGEERDDATGACKKCRAVTAAPLVDDSPNTGFPCPRCGAALERAPFGRAVIKTCDHCLGFFCPAYQLSLIFNDYLADVELPLATLRVCPPGKQPDTFPLVKCIACAVPMDRVNFASRSDAIVDVCAAHGVWLDAGELVPILHFMKTRAELGEVPLTETEKLDQIKRDRETASSSLPVRNFAITFHILMANRFHSDRSDDGGRT